MASEDVNTEKIKEFAELSKTIKITQEKLKILNNKKKQLCKEVIPTLKTNNISKCNFSFGTLKLTKSKRKVPVNKGNIKEKYTSFFNTVATELHYNQSTASEKATLLFNYIYVDNQEFKEENAISMVYNKDFNDQFKKLGV
jgi:hypothetical protein